jgi:hypothetical protein
VDAAPAGEQCRSLNPCRTFAEVSYALLCTVVQFATDVTGKNNVNSRTWARNTWLRTRGSWVQVLPGAPNNQWTCRNASHFICCVATALLRRRQLDLFELVGATSVLRLEGGWQLSENDRPSAGARKPMRRCDDG